MYADMPKRVSPGLPSREQIIDFITRSDQPAGKREIARAFALSGADKIALKALLKDMTDEGLIDSAPGRAFHKMGGIPKVTVLRVEDGFLRSVGLGAQLTQPLSWVIDPVGIYYDPAAPSGLEILLQTGRFDPAQNPRGRTRMILIGNSWYGNCRGRSTCAA